MGLIKAITGAAGGVLADSWRDFYYCDSDVLNENVLAAKGQKRTSDKGRSSNTKGESHIISDGSIIAVNDGQCMIIVESGEIVDVCAEPGQFVYDRSTEPSIFYGSLGEGIKNTFERIGQRFTFGGDTGKDQRVYFFNTKEIIGNKYGTSSPIPFRIVDANLGLDMDTSVRMNGEYSYRLTDPLIFYKKVCGNVEEPYTRDRLDSQMKSELLTALQPALARISEMGVRYSAIPAHTAELAKLLNDELSEDWGAQRGIQVEKFGVNSITLPEEVQQQIANRQMAQTMVDPRQAAAVTANAAANAMQDAANNSAGAMTGFMGMGMAQGMGGQAAATMFQQGAAQQGAYQQPQSAYPMADGGGFGAQPFQQQQPQGAAPVAGAAPVVGAAPVAGGWQCPQCGNVNTGKFCGECGTPMPAPVSNDWTCPKCGTTNAGKFCNECGTPRP
ncbi:MAG: SPFH domain-containing protein [Eggerthellaceae bacterium]|nr:SPFH domain-containing protein [Eggerthellaceae bacterium]